LLLGALLLPAVSWGQIQQADLIRGADYITSDISWSPCVEGFSLAHPLAYYPESDDEYCDYIVIGHNLHLVHNDAVMNCCIDRIDVSVAVSAGLISVMECEQSAAPCECACFYKIETEICHVPRGTYQLEVWSCWQNGDYVLRCAMTVDVL